MIGPLQSHVERGWRHSAVGTIGRRFSLFKALVRADTILALLEWVRRCVNSRRPRPGRRCEAAERRRSWS